MKEELPLHGFMFSGYRSFSDNPAYVGPLGKINFIIGKNNCGKSNVIRFLHSHFPAILSQLNRDGKINAQSSKFSDLDNPHERMESKIGFCISPNQESISTMLESESRSKDDNGTTTKRIQKALQSEAFQHEDKGCWFRYKSTILGGEYNLEQPSESIKSCHDQGEWSHINYMFTGSSSGDLNGFVMRFARSTGYGLKPHFKVELIPAIRSIENGADNSFDFSGKGLTHKLSNLKDPIREKIKEDRQKFEKIETFLKEVTGIRDARIDIPRQRAEIYIESQGQHLPLESLGTGIHEVMILATIATTLENTVVCIEEPELHLHPTLQRKLIQYLKSKTSNQYIFTTHSTAILDTEGASVFHVTLEDGVSNLRRISTNGEMFELASDLGFRASDLLQANSVIWVEGPSDKIYVNSWLSHYAPDLKEGIHFSTMIYGGSIRKHMTATDDPDDSLNEFIQLLSINRNCAMMADSDRSKEDDELKSDTQRIFGEVEKNKGFNWITWGRETENYLKADLVEAYLKEKHSKTFKKMRGKSRWSNYPNFSVESDEKARTTDKVAMAKHFTEMGIGSFDMTTDLEAQIIELADFVSKANGLNSCPRDDAKED